MKFEKDDLTNNALSYKIYFTDNFDSRKVVCMFCLVVVPACARNAYNFCLSENSINLIRMFLKGNNMVQLRLHHGRYYAHAHVLNAYNFCFS